MPLVRKGATPPSSPLLDPGKVLAALASGSEEERWEAARLAPGIPGAAKALADALLREPSARVREVLFTSLTRIVTPESVELLLPFLRLDDARLRTGALDALRAMKGEAWSHVPTLLRDVDPDVRLLACELARDQPGEEAARLLCALLDVEPEANVCASAVEVLAEIGGPEALPALERCARRFRGNQFLEFAIAASVDRIRSPSSPPRE